MTRRHMKDIKQDRYREAYVRIDSAISHDCNFEAIAIVESVLSDRICSFLCSVDENKYKNVYEKSFANLIQSWKDAVHPASIWEECSDLIQRVDIWRKIRNDCIHGFVKFPRNEAKVVSTKEFLEKAKKAAIDGRELSADVYNWRSRQTTLKRKHSRSIAKLRLRNT